MAAKQLPDQCDQKSRRVAIRLSWSEYCALVEQAKAHSVSTSEIVRRVLSCRPIPPSKTDAATILELGKIGACLVQLLLEIRRSGSAHDLAVIEEARQTSYALRCQLLRVPLGDIQ